MQRIAVFQNSGQSCGVSATGYLPFFKELIDLIGVTTNSLRHNVYGCTGRQRRVKIVNMSVEGEGSVTADTIIGGIAIGVNHGYG